MAERSATPGSARPVGTPAAAYARREAPEDPLKQLLERNPRLMAAHQRHVIAVEGGKGITTETVGPSDTRHWASAARSTMDVFNPTHFVPRKPPPPPPSNPKRNSFAAGSNAGPTASIPSWGGASASAPAASEIPSFLDLEQEEADYEALMADPQSARQRRTTPRVLDGKRWLTSKLPAVPQPPPVRYSLPSNGGVITGPESLFKAGEKFDVEHQQRVKVAYACLAKLFEDGGEHVTGREANFSRILHSMGRQRFNVPPHITGPASLRPKTPASTIKKNVADKQFKLEGSVWKARPKWADSGQFHDTDECYERAFIFDWSRALRAHKLASYIVHHDEEGESDDDEAEEEGTQGEGSGDHEIVEVGKVLWRHHLLLYRIFDAYAGAGGPKSDLSSIGYNNFKDFVQDCDLDEPGSKFCDSADFDRLFIQINAKELEGGSKRGNLGEFQLTAETVGVHGMGVTNIKADTDKRALTRYEWVSMVVRISVIKFVMSKEVPDVSQAVDRLFAEIAPKLDPWITMDHDKFRSDVVYSLECDQVLCEHKESLNVIFAYSADSAVDRGAGKEKLRNVLSLLEWIDLLRDLQVLDDSFTLRDATMIFMLSRMRVVNEQGKKSSVKLENLSYEDFFEALVRTALMKALPTDDEIGEAGCIDAGDFMLRLRDAQSEDEWLKEYYDVHGCDMTNAPRQPAHRCLNHLLLLIMRTIERTAVDAKVTKKDVKHNLKVTKKEMAMFDPK
jgi:hypothetical protein